MDNSAQIKTIETEISNLYNVQAAVATVGTVAGFIYANRTGGKFGRYIGYGFLGGVLFGAVTRLILIKKINEKELEITKLKQ